MFPDRCSVKEKDKDCVNPPEFVISVAENDDEYMVGVTCDNHKCRISEKLVILQKTGKIPQGKIKFSKLKPVGTDCIRADKDDLIQL